MMIEAATAEGKRASGPIPLLPPRGSCRAATEGEVPNPTSLVRRQASPSAPCLRRGRLRQLPLGGSYFRVSAS